MNKIEIILQQQRPQQGTLSHPPRLLHRSRRLQVCPPLQPSATGPTSIDNEPRNEPGALISPQYLKFLSMKPTAILFGNCYLSHQEIELTDSTTRANVISPEPACSAPNCAHFPVNPLSCYRKSYTCLTPGSI